MSLLGIATKHDGITIFRAAGPVNSPVRDGLYGFTISAAIQLAVHGGRLCHNQIQQDAYACCPGRRRAELTIAVEVLNANGPLFCGAQNKDANGADRLSATVLQLRGVAEEWI